MTRKSTYGMGRIYQRGRIWWVRYHHNGQEYNESSRSDKEADARKLLRKRLGEIGIGRFAGPRAEKVTFTELAEDFLTDYRINKRDAQKKIQFKLRPLLAAFGNHRVKSITTDRIKSYIADRQSLGAATATINRELSAGPQQSALNAQQSTSRLRYQ